MEYARAVFSSLGMWPEVVGRLGCRVTKNAHRATRSSAKPALIALGEAGVSISSHRKTPLTSCGGQSLARHSRKLHAQRTPVQRRCDPVAAAEPSGFPQMRLVGEAGVGSRRPPHRPARPTASAAARSPKQPLGTRFGARPLGRHERAVERRTGWSQPPYAARRRSTRREATRPRSAYNRAASPAFARDRTARTAAGASRAAPHQGRDRVGQRSSLARVLRRAERLPCTAPARRPHGSCSTGSWNSGSTVGRPARAVSQVADERGSDVVRSGRETRARSRAWSTVAGNLSKAI